VLWIIIKENIDSLAFIAIHCHSLLFEYMEWREYMASFEDTCFIALNSSAEVKESTRNETSSSGHDIIFREEIEIRGFETIKINTGIKVCHLRNGRRMPFFVLPRSSIANTPLILVNSPGLIDCNYQGNLKLAVKNLSLNTFTIECGESYFQITPCDGMPTSLFASETNVIAYHGDNRVALLSKEGRLHLDSSKISKTLTLIEYFGEKTERGEGCFGSTKKYEVKSNEIE
jgi:dUTPase